MTGLNPERHIDKNGKVVTRHVRAQDHTAARRGIPAPSHAPYATDALIQKFVETLPSYGMDSEVAGYILRDIDSFSHELLSDVMDSYLGCSKDERAVWRVALNSGRSGGDLDETHYRRMIEMVHLSVLLFPDAPPGYRSHKIIERAEAAEAFSGVYPGDSAYDETVAHVIVNEVEQRVAKGSGSLDGRIDYIAANLEKVIPLIPELFKRRDASEGVVRGLLEHEVPAIRDGVL